jgi:ABC-type multidrug transport system fused ATPase/permease subunit
MTPRSAFHAHLRFSARILVFASEGAILRFTMKPTPTASGHMPLRVLLEPLKKPLKKHGHLAVLTIIAGWMKFMLPLGVPLLTGHLIDEVLLRPAGPETRAELLHLALYSSGLLLALAVATYYRSALAQQLASQLQHNLRRRLFHHIQRLGMSFFHRHHAGSLGSRVSSDISYAGIVVDKGLIQLSMDGVMLLTLAVIMVRINVPLTLITFALLGGNALTVRKFGPLIRVSLKAIQEQQSSVTGRAAEYFSAISLVKAYGGEKESGRIFSESSAQVRDLQLANSHLQGTFQGISHSLLIAAQVIVALVGAWMILEMPGSLSKGNLVSFLLFCSLINGSVQRLSESLIQIQEGFAALERIHDILELSPNPEEDPQALSPPLSGALRFEHVHFGYGEKRVLHDFNFQFKAGRTYALVGPSGSGKSTLTQLILRFFDPNEGQICLDDTPLTRISLSHYRSQVATVLQDPIIFSTSVRENIGFAADTPSSEAIETAARAALAHDFILQLPKGYDSPLGERGVSLSGGQRQRIAIARALMRDPRILILDEATSALDSVTERSIQDVIEALRGTRTVILIAHRLSTVKNVDEILVLENGRLVETGSFEDLRNRDGLFSRLLHDQSLAEHSVL